MRWLSRAVCSCERLVGEHAATPDERVVEGLLEVPDDAVHEDFHKLGVLDELFIQFVGVLDLQDAVEARAGGRHHHDQPRGGEGDRSRR
jgi:hypothetical protein